ncbi:MAG TPA: hypothetical protein VEI82_04640, partial [Myxococcota bacterium]|nr:hypothetical protein [Myxococcota bacterium]
MERFAPLLLDVWREVGRHTEIGEAVERCTPLVARRLPLAELVVRRLDPGSGALDTVAAARADSAEPEPHLRSALAPAALQELFVFCRRGRPLRGPAQSLARRLPGVLAEGG